MKEDNGIIDVGKDTWWHYPTYFRKMATFIDASDAIGNDVALLRIDKIGETTADLRTAEWDDCRFNRPFRWHIFFKIFVLTLFQPVSLIYLLVSGQSRLIRNLHFSNPILLLISGIPLSIYAMFGIFNYGSQNPFIIVMVMYTVWLHFLRLVVVSYKHAQRSDFYHREFWETEYSQNSRAMEETQSGWLFMSRVHLAHLILHTLQWAGVEPRMPLIFVDHSAGALP